MASTRTQGKDAPAETIDGYIAGCPPKVRPILRKIRAIVRAEAPDATETISYRMPAFKRRGVLIYFAAFTNHIGIYPPVAGSASLERALAPYRGEKGNLRFPLDEPIPYELIRGVVRARVAAQDRKRAARSTPKR